ncbi:hypothetical protein HCG51_26180 [Tolypothrix sp. PCC 7910]|uniref:hypothetical protein n=1 Tax=Tolypothrix sp. PCC 7910 TaxID=2099387 RepID=UPI0014279EDC|nr:hypothetical protein [Tolypothrix sp. PCC 7910]QIR39851.1 hypothetical protein HCG51_26180 [Tolypothrix sp. PCC 7910]
MTEGFLCLGVRLLHEFLNCATSGSLEDSNLKIPYKKFARGFLLLIFEIFFGSADFFCALLNFSKRNFYGFDKDYEPLSTYFLWQQIKN